MKRGEFLQIYDRQFGINWPRSRNASELFGAVTSVSTWNLV